MLVNNAKMSLFCITTEIVLHITNSMDISQGGAIESHIMMDYFLNSIFNQRMKMTNYNWIMYSFNQSYHICINAMIVDRVWWC